MTGLAIAISPTVAFQTNDRLLSIAELTGKGNPELFGEGYKLRKEAQEAFESMQQEALKSDISISIVSSYRNFEHPNSIWERKYKKYISRGLSPEASIEKIIEYSTIPGTSRHHWGTDIDIIDLNPKQPSSVLNPKNFEADACYGNLKQWMDAHAKTFGFYLVYTDESSRKGFHYEPWHYSYKSLSCTYLNEYKTLNLKEILLSEQLLGHTAMTDDFLQRYRREHLLDINPDLL